MVDSTEIDMAARVAALNMVYEAIDSISIDSIKDYMFDDERFDGVHPSAVLTIARLIKSYTGDVRVSLD